MTAAYRCPHCGRFLPSAPIRRLTVADRPTHRPPMAHDPAAQNPVPLWLDVIGAAAIVALLAALLFLGADVVAP